MSETLEVLIRTAGDFAAIAVACWIVVVGGVGAALGAQYGRPVMGFFVATLVPVPVLGWVIVVFVAPRRLSSGDHDSELFEGLLDVRRQDGEP